MKTFRLVLVLILLTTVYGSPARTKSSKRGHVKKKIKANGEENAASFWYNKGQNILQEQLQKQSNTNIAKNIILFLGDGMSLSTITSARVVNGQAKGGLGGEISLFFDNFPFTGLSRTYCVDYTVPDSACTATAYLGGVKGNKGTVGVTAAVKPGDCDAMANTNNHVYSIGKWAQDAGKATGIVTTTKLTDGSPAGVYAHTADRDWENDADVLEAGANVVKCPDIAQQLITGETGRNLNVILGGGRKEFLPEDQDGNRQDNQDLIQVWRQQKEQRNASHVYVQERDDFLSLGEPTDYLLGIFAKKDLHYNLEQEEDEPSLSELTERAIKNLQTNQNGFFLFVEGGNIDNAHHDNWAQRAIDETIQFDKAVQKAVELTSEEDTLILVTADHSHTMTLNGYPKRGKSVLGIGGDGDDDLPYSALSYANGPGYQQPNNNERADISKDDFEDDNYRFSALAPLDSATHNGEDVAVFARGPWSYLFTGSYEENYIPYALAYAACIGQGLTATACPK